MKATFAPLAFKKENPVQSYSRESIFDRSLQDKYDYFKDKGLPVKIPRRAQNKVAYTRANELPFVEFEPSNEYMSKFLVADDSGDRKDEKTGLTFNEKRTLYLNLMNSVQLRLQTSLMNQEYLQWKSFYSPSGPRIRWTGEVSYYGSYIFFTVALRFTQEFFVDLFFKSGLYQTKGGRFLIIQFLEQILNLRFVKGPYTELEQLANIPIGDLDANPIFQGFVNKMTPGFTSAFPVLNGCLAIAQSFFSDRNISFSQLFMKNLPNLLATPTINYVAATFAVNLFGVTVPIMFSQLAASVFVQFLSGQVAELTKVYFFADLLEDERRQKEAEARKEIERERQDELDARRKYVEVGIVGKEIDKRMKMKFDWAGNFGKNIAKFQDGLYTAWKTKGKAVPIFGDVGFKALLGVWGVSTISGFIMFMTTNDFEGYQFATGDNINIRFFFDFFSGMLKSFRFFGDMFSIEALALPVVQKLRNDLIRIFTELATGLFADMKSFVAKSKLISYATGQSYETISRLQKQYIFANYFFTAMEKILETLNNISDPAFRMILENYLNLSVPLSQNIVTNMFRFSIEDSLTLFETMNLFFLEFGVMPLQTAEGQISFYDTVLRQSTRGRITNRAQMLYRVKKDIYSFLKPGTILGEILDFWAIQVPESFAGYEEKVALLPLPGEPGKKVTYLDMDLDNLTPDQRSSIIQIWGQIGMFQKIPALFSYFLKGVSAADMKDPAKMQALFTQKMADPEIKALFGRLRISDADQRLLTPEMFVNFVGLYPTFLQNALGKLNNEQERGTTFTVEHITEAKLDRVTMSRFADLFADEYSQYLTDLVYQNVPMFTKFNGSFSHSYKFQDGQRVSYRNIVVSRGKAPPAGYTEYKTLGDFKSQVLDPIFLRPKRPVKKRGRMVNGQFVPDKDGDIEREVEVEFPLPAGRAEQLVRSFEMLSRMGYTFYYNQSNEGIEGDGSKVSTAENVIGDFEAFFTAMTKAAIPLVEGDAWSPAWHVRFLEEGIYLSPSLELFSAEMNVLQIGENPHFFYNWVKHKGLKNIIYPPSLGSLEVEKRLMTAYRKGLLTGDYLDRFIAYSSARVYTTASLDQVDSNQANEIDALSREYELLGIRTTSEIHMFEIFRALLQDEGDPDLLVGENPEGLTMGRLVRNVMASIGSSGMFPDHNVAIYGSRGGNSTGPVVGDLTTAEKEASIFTLRTPKYKTLGNYYEDENNVIYFQRMLAYILHGWFARGGSPSMYSATLMTNGKPVKTDADLSLLGPNKDTNSLDVLGFRSKVAGNAGSKRLKDLSEVDDDFIILLYFLYLVTDKDGKISVPEYTKHIAALRERRVDKQKQMAYLREQVDLLEAAGTKKSNFVIECLLKRNCYSFETPKEVFVSIGSHTLFQIDYFTKVLKVDERVRDGRGIKTHEIYDGASPYFNTRTFNNPASFFFGYDSFMGIDFNTLKNFFAGSAYEKQFNQFATSINDRKRRLVFFMLNLSGDQRLYESQINIILDILNTPQESNVNWKDAMIQRLTERGSLLRRIFGSDERTPDRIKEFVENLESSYMLQKMLEPVKIENLEEKDPFAILQEMISGRMEQLQTEESVKIEDLEGRLTEILTRYQDQREKLERQMNRIQGLFNDLEDAFLNKKGVRDIPPLVPMESSAPAASSAAADSTGRPRGGPPVAMGEAERPVAKPSAAVREGITVKNELARAEKLANIQHLRTQLSQSQSLAQREDLRLKLMNAYLELFGGDPSFLGGLSNTDLGPLATGLEPFPKPITVKPPEPQPIPDPNPSAFARCALMSNQYYLVGAANVNLMDMPEGTVDEATLEPYMACRTRGVLVRGVKTIFNVLFDITKGAAKFTASAFCGVIGGVLAGLLAAAKAGGACAAGGPFAAAGCAVGGGVFAAVVKGSAAATVCGSSMDLFILWALPKYVARVIINDVNIRGENNLLQKLNSPNNDPQVKIKMYEEFFGSIDRILNDPNTTPEQIREIRDNLRNLFSLLIFESHYTQDDPSRAAQPFTQVLFGNGKMTHFNAIPFFKPSLEQVTFFRNLGVFDFTGIKTPFDLIDKLKEVKLTLDESTLTVLFGQPYVIPEGGMPVQNPSYNIWYRIGKAIQSLDNYDAQNRPADGPPPAGNLFTILTGTSKLITDFFSGETEEFDEVLGIANRYQAEEEEREREAARRESRVLHLGDFLHQAFTLIDNINLDENEENTPIIKARPLLVEKQTFEGFLEKTQASSTGTSGPMKVRVVLGDNDNSAWKDRRKVTRQDRKDFRSLFTTTWDMDNPGFYYKTLGIAWHKTPTPVNPYEMLYNVLDIPEHSSQRSRYFFSPYGGPYSRGYHAWLPGGIDSNGKFEKEEEFYYGGFLSATEKKQPELNMQEYGNFPPFLFCDEQLWNQTYHTQFGRILDGGRFYVRQETNIAYPNGDIRTLYGWFLQRDIDAFAELQPPSDDSYTRITLIDAVFGAKFRLPKFGDQQFSLFLEPGDNDRTKWKKAILLRTIFSTIPGSFKNVVQVGQQNDPYLGPIQVIQFNTKSGAQREGAELQFGFRSEVSPVENVGLRRVRKEQEQRKAEGKENDRDIDARIKTTRDTYFDQLARQPEIFEGVEESQREAATQLLKGILLAKLGKSVSQAAENTRYDEEIQTMFRTNAPTLKSMGRQSIQAAKETLGDAFNAVYSTILSNLSKIQEKLGENSEDLKSLLSQDIDVDLVGGGPDDEGLTEEERKQYWDEKNKHWNEIFEPGEYDVFPVIELSVKQESVYYPDSLIYKYMVNRNT
jgi:hypothetical protein